MTYLVKIIEFSTQVQGLHSTTVTTTRCRSSHWRLSCSCWSPSSCVSFNTSWPTPTTNRFVRTFSRCKQLTKQVCGFKMTTRVAIRVQFFYRICNPSSFLSAVISWAHADGWQDCGDVWDNRLTAQLTCKPTDL